VSVPRLGDDDLRRLERRGVSSDEAYRQLSMLAAGPRFTRLDRPATVGDGIRRITPGETPELTALHEAAAGAGRFVKFTPASGAATRMFRDLLYYHRGAGTGESWEAVRAAALAADTRARALMEFLQNLERFAFHDLLARAVARSGEDLATLAERGAFREVLAAFLEESGLGYASLPKGLLRFHRYGDVSRTAFEEHLVEGADYARSLDGSSRLHFTVSPEHRAGFEERFAAVERRLREALDTVYRVDYSAQDPATDTLAVDDALRPLRDEQGGLLFRPGGHGALIGNLQRSEGDLVFVKNIDNVQPDHLRQETSHWKRLLAGLLLKLQSGAHAHVARLREHGSERACDEATRFLTDELGLDLAADSGHAPASRRQALLGRLERPLRVCGVVPNTGEPGGGPFWVQGTDGSVTLQIVETAQIDPDDEEQQRLLSGATHFNPVDLVCALRDSAGRPFDLSAFVDPEAAIVTRKSSGVKEIRALELPGLWNGAMAGWNTVFVEVPLATFTPVKTVLDLLRPEHQPA
jgi:hypothetical protein